MGDQRSRPAGVRTPRASKTLAMPTNVTTPERRISSTTTFVVALAFARRAVLAALALAAVSALPAVPSLVPRVLAAASAARVRSLILRACHELGTLAPATWHRSLSVARPLKSRLLGHIGK